VIEVGLQINGTTPLSPAKRVVDSYIWHLHGYLQPDSREPATVYAQMELISGQRAVRVRSRRDSQETNKNTGRRALTLPQDTPSSTRSCKCLRQ